MTLNLANKHRPTDWDQLIGQEMVVSKCQKLLKKGLPHTILLSGPTGTGKSTTARILASKLGVEPIKTNPNYVEMNCADCRGIDDVRAIQEEMSYSSMDGKPRVWVLEELVQWPTASQQAALVMLEHPPAWVYFFLCTTKKQDLLDTVLGRCHVIDFKKISEDDLKKIIYAACGKENKNVSVGVAKKITELADGSARMALQLLEAVLTQDTEEKQLAAIEEAASETLGIDLARAIMYKKPWSDTAKIIESLGQEVETVRRIVLKYAESVLLNLKSGPGDIQGRAYFVINEFRDSWHSCGRAGLIAACWRVSNGK